MGILYPQIKIVSVEQIKEGFEMRKALYECLEVDGDVSKHYDERMA